MTSQPATAATQPLDRQALSLRATSMIAPALRWLCRQQLPTGEMAAYHRVAGLTQCWPAPLYSVLVMDLLACADPQTPRFSRALHDAVPADERRALTSAVVTLRWRLRGYIASQQRPDGLWQRHGHDGNSPIDAATTALATAAFFDDRGAPVVATRALAINLEPHTSGLFAEAARLYLLAIIGEDIQPRAQSLLANNANDDPLARAAACWLFARCWADAHSDAADAWRHSLLDELLAILISADEYSAVQALALLALLQLRYHGEALDRALTTLLLHPAPPWRWPPAPLIVTIDSPAFLLAVVIHTLAFALDGGTYPC